MKIDVYSGFLGAGKTTLIKKLIKEAYAGEKVVLIENEFGEIGIDGGFLEEAGVNITEMNSGCICCSLVGDFAKALSKVAKEYNPDRVVIEPSGVGKLSDVIKAVKNAGLESARLNAFCTVVDAPKCKMYMKNFGEFFGDQVEHASCIVLSHTHGVSSEKVETAVALLKSKNPCATIVSAEWDELDGKTLLNAIEGKQSLAEELKALEKETVHRHEHHHECHDEHCDCHHHHHEHHHHEHECDDPNCGCHHHHNHDEHGHGCCEHHEHHHHEHECHDEHCTCHEHHEHHHEHGAHHHHADEVFTSWGVETAKRYTKGEIENALRALSCADTYGTVLRAKGIVAGNEGWIHFDYVPEEPDVREGKAGVTGRLCVIGCHLNEDALKALFNV